MSNFWKDILMAAGDEPIEAVVIGDAPWSRSWQGGDARNKIEQKIGVVLTADEARPMLDYEYDEGFGGVDCNPIHAYTPNRILVVHEYDGSTGVYSVPRNPSAELPEFV